MTYGEPTAAVGSPYPSSVAERAACRTGRRFSWPTRLRIGILAAFSLLLFAPPAVVSFDRVREQVFGPSNEPRPVGQARLDGERQAVTNATDQSSVPGSSGDPEQGRVRDKVGLVLRQQSEALLAGNRAGFVALVDVASPLRAVLERRFDTLRSMRVARWEQTIAEEPTKRVDSTWSVSVKVRYCFVVAGCPPVAVTVGTQWADANGQLRMVALGNSSADQIGPRPWEVSRLRASVGKRVVVAGTSRWASRLPGVLAAAERAATVADRYSRWDKPPGRYVVYLAGPDEWGKWYGVRQASWVAAYAMPLTATYTEIVLNAAKVGLFDVSEVLRHEFTHVVTLSGVKRTYPNSWWLVEGIAEYVQNFDKQIWGYRALGDGRRFVRYSWNGNVALDEPDPKASTSEANGHYAVAFLAVRRLAVRFGEPKMLDFFDALARRGSGLEAASMAAFGVSWKYVSADCALYVRRTLG